jgi:hypothetical protein
LMCDILLLTEAHVRQLQVLLTVTQICCKTHEQVLYEDQFQTI